MNAYVDKTKKSGPSTVANGAAQKQGNGKSTFQFVNNRPEAIVQRKMKALANRSLQAKPLNEFQRTASKSPQSKQATQLQETADQSVQLNATATVQGPKSSPTLSHGSPAKRPPIQRALNVKVLGRHSRDYRILSITKALHDYNQGVRSKSRKAKISELDAIQFLLFSWFDQYKEDLIQQPIGLKLKDLLNEVQREHIKVVRAAVINQDTEPPVAGFDQFTLEIQKKITTIWTDLVNETGNIIITEDQDYTSKQDQLVHKEQHRGFKYEALAAFARLLQSAFGQELLVRANKDTGDKKPITIRPGNSLGDKDIPSEEFIAKATETGKSDLIEINPDALYGTKKKGSKAWKKVNKFLKKFPKLVIPESATIEDRIKLIHDAPKTFKNQGCYKVKDNGGMRYYKFNEGVSAEIVFTNDVKDATDHMTSRFIDEEGNEIIVPVFISLAHELGHALHYVEGNTVGKLDKSLGNVIAPGENFYDWSNLEEFNTIKGVENEVRKDTGATIRFSHDNYLFYTAKMIRIGPLDKAYTATALLQNPAKKNIEDLLGEADSALGLRDLKAAKKLLAKALQLLDFAKKELEKQQLVTEEPESSYFNFWPFV